MLSPVRLYTLLFVLALVGVGIWHNFATMSQYGPAGLHSWRQADGVAIAHRYYLDGLDFFAPATFYTKPDVPRHRGEAVGELPLTYYLAAVVYHLTGPDTAVLRWIHFLLLALGLYALGRWLLDWWGSVFYALFFPLLLYSSPVVALFGFNFLPNTVALGYLLLGTYAYYRYTGHRRWGWYVLALLLILLCGLTKPTLLVPVIAWVLIGSYAQWRPGDWGARLFPRGRVWWGGLAFFVAAMVGWITWSQGYYDTHKSPVFLLRTTPVWKYDADYLRETWFYVSDRHYLAWLHPAVWVGSGLAFLYGLWGSWRRRQYYLVVFLLFTLLGTLSVVVLFFKQWLAHNYYFIDLLPLFIGAWVVGNYQLGRRHPQLGHWLPKIVLAAGLVFFSLNAARYVRKEWSPAGELAYFHQDLKDAERLRAYVRSIGIEYPKDRVGVIGEDAPNYVLSYLGQLGTTQAHWTLKEKQIRRFGTAKTLDYLLLTHPYLVRNPAYLPVLTEPLGRYGDSLYFYRVPELTE